MTKFPHGVTPASNPRLKAALAALAVGIVLLVAKLFAWLVTDSQTVLSDDFAPADQLLTR